MVICFLVLTSIVIYIFRGSALSIQSDTATANLLAREQIISGKLFPKGWYYAQEIWIFALNIPILVISKFLDNQIIIREIAVLMFVVIALISVVLFHKKIFRDNSWLISVPLLFSGMSEYYIMQLFGEAAYTSVVFIVFLSITMFLMSINQNFEIINKKLFFMLLIFLIFWGVGSIRYMEVIDIPLVASICVLYLKENGKQCDEKIIKSILFPIKICIYIGISAIISFVLFHHIIANVNYITGQAGVSYLSLNSGKMALQNNIFLILNSLLNIIGIRENVLVFSIQGILNVFRLTAAFFLLIVFPLQLYKRYKTESFAVKFLIIFNIISILLNLFLALFSNLYIDMTSIRYFFVCLYLLFVMDAYYIYHYLLKKMNILVRVIILFCITVNSMLSSMQLISPSINYDEKLEQKCKIETFLNINDLHYGYASYWNAGVNTLISNYNIQINAITFNRMGNLSPYYWLSSELWYKPNNYKGKSFLMLTEEEDLTFRNSLTYKSLGEAKKLSIDNYVIYVYPYNIAERAWIQKSMDIDEEINIFPVMFLSNQESILDNQLYALNKRDIMYGPYMDLNKGSYTLAINVDFDQSLGLQDLMITSDSGENILRIVALKKGENLINIDLDKPVKDVEFVIQNTCFNIVNISKETLKRNN